MPKWFMAAVFSLGLFSQAFALTPYTKEAYEKAQQNDEKILLYFHVDWCPNCVAMKKALTELEAAGEMNGFTTFIADFDKEKELAKYWSVKYQSTLVSQKGRKQTGTANALKEKEALIKYFVTSGLK